MITTKPEPELKPNPNRALFEPHLSNPLQAFIPEPTADEVREYAAYLGLDLEQEAHLKWIVIEGVFPCENNADPDPETDPDSDHALGPRT